MRLTYRWCLLALCGALAILAAGCGGGGGPAPTNADLYGAASQVMSDSVEVFNTFELANENEVAALETKVVEQVLPNLGGAENGLFGNFGVYEIIFGFWLFHIEPDTYAYADLDDAPQDDVYYQGEWVITDVEGTTMRVTVNRVVSGLNDVITYNVTDTADPDLDYHGRLVYPTKVMASLDGEMGLGLTVVAVPLAGSIELYAADQNLSSLTLSGTIEIFLPNLDVDVHGELRADFEGTGSSGPYSNYLELEGDLSFHHTPGTEDVFEGRLETADLILAGRIGLTWVNNPDFLIPGGPVWFQQVCPSKLTVRGSIRDKAPDPMMVEGTLTMELLNATTFNPAIDYHDWDNSNFPHFKASLAMLVQVNSGNKIKATIGVELAGYLDDGSERVIITGSYELTKNGTARRLTLLMSNESPTDLHLEIDSTWGPAKVVMNATFNPGIEEMLDGEADLDDVTGEVYVGGTQVGTISLNTSLNQIEINYVDGISQDTFPL